MDDAAWHLETIREKHLPVDEINAYNHMAIYLRWCMEHDLMSVEFIERYSEQYQAFLADIKQADLRSFIRDVLKGQLFGALFNEKGAAFAGYYYGESDSPYYPSDIDSYAVSVIGFSLAGFLLTFGVLLFQDKLPLNPQGFPGLFVAFGLEYGGQLPDEYELAVLRRGNHREPFFADGGPDVSEFRFRRRRHRRVRRGRARHRPQRIFVHRQLLGRSRAHHAVRVVAFEHHRGAAHALAGHGSEFRRGRYRGHP